MRNASGGAAGGRTGGGGGGEGGGIFKGRLGGTCPCCVVDPVDEPTHEQAVFWNKKGNIDII